MPISCSPRRHRPNHGLQPPAARVMMSPPRRKPRRYADLDQERSFQ